MLQIAAEIVLDLEIALVDGSHPGKRVHGLENFAVLVVNDDAFFVSVGEPFDFTPGPIVGDLLDGEVEFVTRDEVDSPPCDEALLGFDRDFCTDHANFDVWIDRLDHLGNLHVRFEGWGRGVHHH